MTAKRRAVVQLLVVLALLVIGWFDYAIGPDASLAVIYLLPIATAAWWLGPRVTALVVLLSTVAWYLGSYGISLHAPAGAVVWNVFARLLSFGLTSGLIVWLKRERAELLELRDRLARELGEEGDRARRDMLTGLPNRRGFVEAIESAVERRARDLTVAYVDLDNFKAVNDRYGHDAGDALLCRFADAIRAVIREGDLAARLGGDEFAVVFYRAPLQQVESALARLIRLATDAAAQFEGTHVGASIGVIHFTTLPRSSREIIARADQAMYEAKRAGKGQVRIVREGEILIETASVP